VTDTGGQPLPGVSIVIKGSTQGTVTDNDGEFLLNEIPPDATLIFSFVGMKTKEIVVGSQTIINVRMEEDVIGIEEVVAIGYGTMQKSDLTGSVTRADLTTLEDSPNVSLLQKMHGTVPGLNVGMATKAGESPSVSIRGINTISGSNSPLIVLDGMIFRDGLSSIDPNSIESVDILKDASSAAIYGSQAANGVILITSKIPKINTKPTIEYKSNFSFQDFTNKDYRPNNREQYLEQIALAKLFESRMPPDYLEPNPNFDPSRYFSDTKYIEGLNDGTDTDWLDLMTNDYPMIQDHSLSVRGKSELVTYFVSFNYINQNNLIKNDYYDRYNIRINIETSITDWLKIGMRSFFNINDLTGYDIDLSFIGHAPPLAKAYDENGEIILQPLKGSTINPLATIETPQFYKTNNLTGNFYTEIDLPIKGLSYTGRYSQNIIHHRNFQFNPYEHNFTGHAYKSNETQEIKNFDNIIKYKRDFGLHGIDATLVYGFEKRELEGTSAAAQRFEDQTLGYNFLQAGQSDLYIANSWAWEESSLFSMGRLVYKYNDNYIFTGTIRRDGFSGFGQKNKFGLFPSAAFAWRMSEESFMKNISWLDYLKLRLSYGANGNRTLSRYQTLGKTMTINPYNWTAGGYLYGDGASPQKTLALESMENENLKWEVTNSFNFGTDFSFMSDRLFGSIDYYISKTKDLLYNISIPYMNGVNINVPTNIGELGNTGQEFILTGTPILKTDFEWSITGNISRNRNKVVSILGIDADKDGKEDDLVADKIFIDKPLGVIYDYNVLGVWSIEEYNEGKTPDGWTCGNYKFEDINNDGEIKADDDRKILGFTSPSYRFGIQNTFIYKKNWSLKVFINSIQGGKDYFKQMQPIHIFQLGWTETNALQYDYWSPENPDGKFRGLNGTSRLYYVGIIESRSFIRLKEVTLSYNLPKEWLSNVNISKTRLFLSGTNLLALTNWSGWDPETGQGVGYMSYYPVPRTYNIGLNIEF
jgi:TonB-dependent starch-binding outer membrane protein SusC